jgi:hypothetical protein
MHVFITLCNPLAIGQPLSVGSKCEGIQKEQYWNIFIIQLATLLRPTHKITKSSRQLYLSALTTTQLLSNILIHSYTFHCGRQMSILGNQLLMDLCPFIPSDTKNALVHVVYPWCKQMQSSHLHAMLTWHKRTTELHLQYVIIWPWVTAGLSKVSNHTIKI